MATGLSDFFKFNLWANQRMLEVCEKLSEEQLDETINGTFGSIRETLKHTLGAEEGYTRTLTGSYPTTPAIREGEILPTFPELHERVQASGEALIQYANQVTPPELAEILHLDGGTYDAPRIIVVMQAIDHGIDHRSQIATLLSQLGIEPPELDTWAYN